ncbi:spore cortex biosynthesis protein YabQ [Acetanaerobacterium elongatum]|uniref:spore cortex biosynthesis protein YabQ n=1 Tax=Acetanaerobacterium elongatum TaxID=258515 RepID=UPI0013BE95FB|nr:spore cortex biosynthesis protein YabQ [Acetanaerobacterium elongatum]
MEVVVSHQTVLFLQACLLGFLLGIFYEIFRILRLLIQTGPVAIFVQDILYWSVSALISFLFILAVNSGQLRIFLLLGIVIGMVVYFLTLGVLVMKASKAIIAFIHRVMRFIYRKLVAPVQRFMGITRQKADRFAKKVESKNKIIKNNMNYSLKQYRLLLYNLLHTTKSENIHYTKQKRGIGEYEKKRGKKRKDSSHH